MINATNLKNYTMLDFKIDRFFKKLDNKVRRKMANGGRRLEVVVYDKFVNNPIIFSEQKRKSFHSDLYADYVICDPEVFLGNNRSLYMFTIQRQLVHDFGYSGVSWTPLDNDMVCNGMQLSFYW